MICLFHQPTNPTVRISLVEIEILEEAMLPWDFYTRITHCGMLFCLVFSCGIEDFKI